MRVDQFLWAARFYKTRSLASAEIQKGRVQVNGSVPKPAKEIKIGDEIVLPINQDHAQITVQLLPDTRRDAAYAKTLYSENASSLQTRQENQAKRKLYVEPALAISQRPSKRDRRALEKIQQQI